MCIVEVTSYACGCSEVDKVDKCVVRMLKKDCTQVEKETKMEWWCESCYRALDEGTLVEKNGKPERC